MSIIIIGRNTILEALKVNHKIYELYIQKGTNSEIIAIANDKNIKIKEMDKFNLNKTLPANNQGVGALVEEYKYQTLEKVINKEKTNKVFVMLDSLEDPHNLGAILRSADAFNVDAIIIGKNRSVKLNSTVAKVSTGAIEHVDVVEVTNLTQTLKTLKKNGFWVVGTDASTEKTIHDIDVDTNLCVVIGNEGKGISRLVKENCDYIVKIPMSGHVNSLNASVSAALVIYEIYHLKGWSYLTYPMYNDYEIINLIREGNNEALELMFDKYSRLISKKIYKFNLYKDYDDMFQEGMMILYKSIKAFNEIYKKSFTRYFELNLERKYMTILTKRIRRMEIFKNNELFIYETNNNLNQNSVYYELLKKEIAKILTNNEHLVYTLRELNNYSITYISEKHSMTDKEIYNSLHRAKVKIKKHFNK